MKLVFFLESHYKGGTTSFLINTINNWPVDSDEIVIMCNSGNPSIEEFKFSIRRSFNLVEYKFLTFMYFFNRRGRKSIFGHFIVLALRFFSFILRYIFLVKYIFLLRRYFLKNRADRLMVVYGGYPNGDCCRAASIAWGLFINKPKSILNLHGQAVGAPWRIRLQESLVDAFVAGLTSQIVSVSKACAATVSRRFFLNKIPIRHIYNGVELSGNVGKKSIKEELKIKEADQFCVMMGTYDKNKGHDFLLKSFKITLSRVPSVRLLICGDGSFDQIQRVKNKVLNMGLGDSVHLLGYRRDAADIIRQASVLLIASQDFESFNLSSVEAMSCKVPVVATNTGALPEVVINEEGGYCVDKRDPFLFSDFIVRLLKNEELRKAQGLLGFSRYMNTFNARTMAEGYSALFH